MIIHSTNIYCGSKMLQELLRAGAHVVNKTDKLPGLTELAFQWGKIGNAPANKE